MDMTIEKSKKSQTTNRVKAVTISLVIAGVVLAAASFVPNDQPWGYIAPPALSGSNFKKDDVIAFTPWFEEKSFKGDLIAYPVATDGSVGLLNPKWKASLELDVLHYLDDRKIVTTDGDGTAGPFLFDSLTGDQQTMVQSEDVVNYVRGDRSKEGSGYRTRSSVVGNIVHSAPVYLGKAIAGYLFDDYLEFAENNANRDGRVYVGANAGMLHAFDAETGVEEFAYVPSMVMANLSDLTSTTYQHQYFVDGHLTIEDAQWDNDWHSVLVGGLGAGGKGYFALDVTSPDASSEDDAADKILWELHTGSDGGANIGYSYSRPSVIRLKKDDSWVAVVGNGYMSANGVASLFVINIETGAVIKELVVSDSDGNGLSSPTIVDANFDGYADTAYAGDLNGNVWKFDLEPENPDSWSVDLSGWPLFTTTAGQAITTAPEVGRHPTGEGVMVYVGTGRLFDLDDSTDKTAQAVYGLWDKGSSVSLASLVTQTLTTVSHSSGEAVRVASNSLPDWDTNGGWVTSLQISGANSLNQGERVTQDLLLRDSRVYLMSSNPTVGTGDNWFIQLNADTGGAPAKVIVDINQDQLLNSLDNVDVDGDGAQTAADERVVGQYQDFGLASRPVVGSLSTSQDSALINHLTAITPINLQTIPDGEKGLVGGHFDLDTSSEIYDFDNGETDGHVHEWDDEHDLTTIDYLDLAGGDGDPLHEINHSSLGIDEDEIFVLTIGNTELSPGGILEINSSSLKVTEYHDAVNTYLQDSEADPTVIPRYKFGTPTTAEAAAGVQQLTSLKLSFDAFTLINGGLIPTETGCMKDNTPGIQGEYRNGALLIQALDASNVSTGYILDEDTGVYEAGSSAVHAELGYATRGLFWESTVFWHWDGDCYGEGDWEDDYRACFIDDTVDCVGVSEEADDKAKKTKDGKKDKKDDGGDGGDGGDDSGDTGDGDTGGSSGGDDSGHNVSNTTVGGSNDVGRLFWKELIPEE